MTGTLQDDLREKIIVTITGSLKEVEPGLPGSEASYYFCEMADIVE